MNDYINSDDSEGFDQLFQESCGPSNINLFINLWTSLQYNSPTSFKLQMICETDVVKRKYKFKYFKARRAKLSKIQLGCDFGIFQATVRCWRCRMFYAILGKDRDIFYVKRVGRQYQDHSLPKKGTTSRIKPFFNRLLFKKTSKFYTNLWQPNFEKGSII